MSLNGTMKEQPAPSSLVYERANPRDARTRVMLDGAFPTAGRCGPLVVALVAPVLAACVPVTLVLGVSAVAFVLVAGVLKTLLVAALAGMLPRG